jgi:hypothetical protein
MLLNLPQALEVSNCVTTSYWSTYFTDLRRTRLKSGRQPLATFDTSFRAKPKWEGRDENLEENSAY